MFQNQNFLKVTSSIENIEVLVQVRSNKDSELNKTSGEMAQSVKESLHLELPEKTITSTKSKEKKRKEKKDKRHRHRVGDDRLD